MSADTLAGIEHCEESTADEPWAEAVGSFILGIIGGLLLISGRGTFVTDNLGRPSIMSLSLLSLISFALDFFEALLAKGSVMGEFDLELALSKEDGGDDEETFVGGKLLASPELD